MVATIIGATKNTEVFSLRPHVYTHNWEHRKMYGRLIVDDVMTEDIHLQSGDTSSLITAVLQQICIVTEKALINQLESSAQTRLVKLTLLFAVPRLGSLAENLMHMGEVGCDVTALSGHSALASLYSWREGWNFRRLHSGAHSSTFVFS